MRDNAPITRSVLDCLRHVGFWVLLPLAVYVAYVLIDVALRPDPNRLPELVERLPLEDHDHADELLQLSWVQIYRKRARFSGKGSFQGWALAVSRNVCRMSVRGSSKPVPVSLDDHGDIPDAAAGPAARLARRRRAKALYTALEKLSDRERQAIMLRLLEGRRTSEVAKAMGVKEVSVRSLVHRGLRKLRRMKSLKQAILETKGLRQ